MSFCQMDKRVDTVEDSEPSDLALVMAARQGCSVSMEKLLSRYHYLILSCSRKYFIRCGGIEDLYQEGCIGFYLAVRDYRPSLGASFRTFAELCICRYILNAVKGSTRKKHLASNHAISLDMPVLKDEGLTLLACLPDLRLRDVADEVIEKERVREIIAFLKQELSPLEFTVAFLQSYSYGLLEISEMLNLPYKTVDNAVQRIRKKFTKRKIVQTE